MAYNESMNKKMSWSSVHKVLMESSSSAFLNSLIVDKSANPTTHDVIACGGDAAYTQSRSSSLWVGYGDSSSSCCFFSACFCICFMASVKVVRLGAVSNSHFNIPPHPDLGIAGEPRDMGVLQLDPQPQPGAQESPTFMGKPGVRPSMQPVVTLGNWRSHATLEASDTRITRSSRSWQMDGMYGSGGITVHWWCLRSWCW